MAQSSDTDERATETDNCHTNAACTNAPGIASLVPIDRDLLEMESHA